MYYKNTHKSRKVISVTVNGTTFTGDPTRTTLGNTLRSYSYLSFVRHKAGVPKRSMKFLCAGDDVKIVYETMYET